MELGSLLVARLAEETTAGDTVDRLAAGSAAASARESAVAALEISPGSSIEKATIGAVAYRFLIECVAITIGHPF